MNFSLADGSIPRRLRTSIFAAAAGQPLTYSPAPQASENAMATSGFPFFLSLIGSRLRLAMGHGSSAAAVGRLERQVNRHEVTSAYQLSKSRAPSHTPDRLFRP